MEQKMRFLTDEEINHLGYQALKEKLGVIGATRFIGLQTQRAGEDYAEIRDEILKDITLEEIWAEAEREKERDGEG